jgi:hypothetical protein
VQLDTPDEMSGRVAAVNSIFIGSSNQLGEVESGATAASLGLAGLRAAGKRGDARDRRLWIPLLPELLRREWL